MYGKIEIKNEKELDLNYYKELNDKPGFYKSVLGVLLNKDGKSYNLKLSCFGYNNNMIEGLRKYVVKGNIDNIDSNKVIVYSPFIDNKPVFDVKIGETIRFFYAYNNDVENLFKGKNISTNYKDFKVGALANSNVFSEDYYVGNDSVHILVKNDQFDNIFGINKYRAVNIYKNDGLIERSGEYLDKVIYRNFSRYNGVNIVNVERENNELMYQLKNKITMIKMIAATIFIFGVIYLINVVVNEFIYRIDDYKIINMLSGRRSLIMKLSFFDGIIIGGL